jgi:hypothetical protein
MRHCYRCGAEVLGAGFRRVVETGRGRRVYSGKRRTSVSHSRSEGLRTLCESCAEASDRKAAFETKARVVFFCCVAALLGIGYINQPPKGQESLSAVQQDSPTLSRNQANAPEPTETGSINPSAAPLPEQTNAPLIGAPQSLMDPNFSPDAERVQDRLRSLGFPVSDPQGIWSKSTDLAVRRFRKSRGLRSDWRWDVSTQTALFAQAR